MRRGVTYFFAGAVMLLLWVCCSPYYGVTKGYRLPVAETTPPLDRDKFLAYIDTAAVDDWEGLWLLVGPDTHCFVAIERMNDMSHNVYYSHRIRMWSSISYTDNLLFEQGEVLGYLGQGLYEDTKNMTLQMGLIFKHEIYKGVIQLDKSRKHIIIDTGRDNIGDTGMRRIYPIRTVEERDYKVRYL